MGWSDSPLYSVGRYCHILGSIISEHDVSRSFHDKRSPSTRMSILHDCVHRACDQKHHGPVTPVWEVSACAGDSQLAALARGSPLTSGRSCLLTKQPPSSRAGLILRVQLHWNHVLAHRFWVYRIVCNAAMKWVYVKPFPMYTVLLGNIWGRFGFIPLGCQLRVVAGWDLHAAICLPIQCVLHAGNPYPWAFEPTLVGTTKRLCPPEHSEWFGNCLVSKLALVGTNPSSCLQQSIPLSFIRACHLFPSLTPRRIWLYVAKNITAVFPSQHKRECLIVSLTDLLTCVGLERDCACYGWFDTEPSKVLGVPNPLFPWRWRGLLFPCSALLLHGYACCILLGASLGQQSVPEARSASLGW